MPAIALGQSDTTAKDFFPVQVGNKWFYQIYSPDLGTSYQTSEVTRDSIGPSGTHYVEFNRAGSYTYSIDTSSNVFLLPVSPAFSTTLLYKLDANKDSVWATGGSPSYVWIEEVYQSMVFGKNTTIKVFRFSQQHRDSGGASFYLYEQHLAKEFGLVWEWAEPAQTRSLRGCIIQGDTSGVLTKVDELVSSQTSFQIELEQNFPNPFNPSTTIEYSLARSGYVEILILDVLGRAVARLVNKIQTPGAQTVVWDGKDGNGQPISSGIYFYQLLISGTLVATKKLIFLK